MQSGEVQTVKRLHFMPWPEAAKALQRPGSTVVWPFGAMEQHGPQLPLATDALFAERILDAVLGGACEGPAALVSALHRPSVSPRNIAVFPAPSA